MTDEQVANDYIEAVKLKLIVDKILEGKEQKIIRLIKEMSLRHEKKLYVGASITKEPNADWSRLQGFIWGANSAIEIIKEVMKNEQTK